jgi:hypothetical protein
MVQVSGLTMRKNKRTLWGIPDGFIRFVRRLLGVAYRRIGYGAHAVPPMCPSEAVTDKQHHW